MKTVNKQVVTILRILISLLFLVSALAKLYPVPIIGITKIFEEGQLIPMFVLGLSLRFGTICFKNNYRY